MTIPQPLSATPARAPYDLCDAAHDYPARGAPPRRSILICSQPRAGTTMLGEALYFAGDLGCPLEYVHVGFRAGFAARWGTADTRALLDAVRRHRTDPGGTLAVKLFWRDVAELAAELAPGDFPDLRTVPAEAVAPDTYRRLAALLAVLFPAPAYVHLDRRDGLRQAVSAVSARQTGVFRRIGTDGGASPARAVTPDVTYDFDAIGAVMADNRFCQAHWRAFFAGAGIAAHPMTYEALVADYAGSVAALLARLGHPGPVPPVRMERQSTAASEALMRRFLHDQRTAARG